MSNVCSRLQRAESLATFMAFEKHSGRARTAEGIRNGDKCETLCSCSVFGNKLDS